MEIGHQLYIMAIGLPYSGKSSFFQKLANKIPEIKLLSTDAYIENLAKYEGQTYNDLFDKVYKRAEKNMWLEREKYLNDNETIYHDQTNLTSKARKKKLKNISDSYYKIALVFDTPIDVIQERHALRKEKVISLDVMEKLVESSESLESIDENNNVVYESGYNEIIRVTPDNNDIEDVINHLYELHHHGFYIADMNNISEEDKKIIDSKLEEYK